MWPATVRGLGLESFVFVSLFSLRARFLPRVAGTNLFEPELAVDGCFNFV